MATTLESLDALDNLSSPGSHGAQCSANQGGVILILSRMCTTCRLDQMGVAAMRALHAIPRDVTLAWVWSAPSRPVCSRPAICKVLQAHLRAAQMSTIASEEGGAVPLAFSWLLSSV
eukprot:4698585-Amphidinium_carterae.2